MKEQKCLNLRPKICNSGIFGLKFEKNIVIFDNSLRICQNTNFCESKMPKFGTKNVLFGYFWARLFRDYCHI